LYLNDSAINISEIQMLDDLRTDMIVLSACRTGVGKHAKGEGVFSLARAFIAAGISSTVTTLWKVDNQPTYQITELFYKYISQGLPKDVALQQAKLEFIKSNGKSTELPCYWAASILIGKSDAITNTSTNKMVILGFSVTMLTLLTILFMSLYSKKLRYNMLPAGRRCY
jgi:CHAT domain-containing protein